MKKFAKVLLAAMLMMTMVACGSKDEAFKGGNFSGTAKGFGGDVTVELTLDANKTITAINTTSSETDGIGETAIDVLTEKVLNTNSLEVEAVSGATISSEAFVAAATAALEAAGLKAADLVAKENESAGNQTLEADVVVIGAGGAGMTAAITAAQAGKSVIIVESAAITGGNTSRATGGMNAAATSVQKNVEFAQEAKLLAGIEKAKAYPELADLVATVEKQYEDWKANPEGYFDTPELFVLDTMVGGYCKNNIELVTTLANGGASAIDWLGSLPTPLTLTMVGTLSGASVNRAHKAVNAEGKMVSVGSYMVPLLEENCKTLGVEIMTETKATEIVMVDGAAAGIVAVNGETTYTINAKSVVLASGGFGGNLDMVVENKASLAGFVSTNGATIDGSGIKMAVAVGAATVDMGEIQIHPTVYVNPETGNTSLITESIRGDGAIVVNQEGVRFVNEDETRDVVSAAVLEQTGGYAWVIFDQKMYDASATYAGYVTKGLCVAKEGLALADLAAAIGVDATVLETTVSTWNTAVTNQKDEEFGRNAFKNTLDETYYAVKINPGIHHCMGGVVINTNTEVLDTNGNAIANLFAAGEVTGGVHGANRLGGNAVADIVVFGRIAGAAAAANAE